MSNEEVIRPIHQDKVQKLLELYQHLHKDDPDLHWEDIKLLILSFVNFLSNCMN